MRFSVAFAIGLCACAGYHPPTSVAPDRGPTSARASFGKTWEAVVDWVGKANLSVSTIDRTSGFVAVHDVQVSADTDWADCGRDAYGRLMPSQAKLDIVVHGDSTTSSVRVNVAFSSVESHENIACVTRGVLEKDVEQWIKQAAETRVLPPWRWPRAPGDRND